MGVKKCCNKCKVEKSIGCFYKQKNGLLGRTGECKICRRERTKKFTSQNKEKRNAQARLVKRDRSEYNERWRKKNPEYFKEYYKQNKEIRLAANRRFFLKHPERRKLYKIYASALYQGILLRSNQCQICGSQDQKIQGHHFDYKKPLEVTWLCVPCHKQIHKKRKFIQKDKE